MDVADSEKSYNIFEECLRQDHDGMFSLQEEINDDTVGLNICKEGNPTGIVIPYPREN
jgi:hypothetical protein